MSIYRDGLLFYFYILELTIDLFFFSILIGIKLVGDGVNISVIKWLNFILALLKCYWLK